VNKFSSSVVCVLFNVFPTRFREMVKDLSLIRQLGGLCYYTMYCPRESGMCFLDVSCGFLINPIGLLLDELSLHKGRMCLFTKY